MLNRQWFLWNPMTSPSAKIRKKIRKEDKLDSYYEKIN